MNAKIILIALLSTILAGCATSKKTKHLDQGRTQGFHAPFEWTWNAAIDAVLDNQLTLLTTNLSAGTGLISAQHRPNTYLLPQNVTIWIKSQPAGETEVRIVSKSQGPRYWSRNWEAPLLRAIANTLGPPTATPLVAASTAAPPTNPPPSTTVAPASPKPVDASAPSAPTLPVVGNDAVDLKELRERLRQIEHQRTEELRMENDPRRRERLQSELDYVHQEILSVENRLQRVKD